MAKKKDAPARVSRKKPRAGAIKKVSHAKAKAKRPSRKKTPSKQRRAIRHPHAKKRPLRRIRPKLRSDDQKSQARPPKPRSRISPERALAGQAIGKEQRQRLTEALKIVRKHVKGYEPTTGWRIRDLDRITPQRKKTLLKKAATLKELLRQPHELVKAPTAKARKNLYQFTRQKIRNAKHYIVHKPADNFSVHVRSGRVLVRGHFEGKVRGKRRRKIVTESAFYLFPKAVKHPDDAERMLQDMLDEMPEGYYVMLTGAHGDTGEPADKGSLLSKLRQYINAYQFAMTTVLDSRGVSLGRVSTDQGFAQAIVGFRLLSTTADGMQLQMQARDIRRQRTAEYNEKLRRERMSKKERVEYEAPRKLEEKRQARRRAAKKAAKTRARKHK